MKKIFLACFLLSAGTTATFAQNANPTTAGIPQDNAGRVFTARIAAWDASIGRKAPEAAQKQLMELMGMMQSRIADDNRALAAAANEADKKALQSKLKAEQETYTDVKIMSVDVLKNASEIRTKLQTFSKNY